MFGQFVRHSLSNVGLDQQFGLVAGAGDQIGDLFVAHVDQRLSIPLQNFVHRFDGHLESDRI